MSNLVIVAIPDENDRVWKVSSEKIPHLTVLFLGDVDQISNLETIVQFVEHAANTTLRRFYLPVDRRGELGEDKADVLFFKKGRYDYKAIRDFRAALLQDSNIKTAYDSAKQFEGPWNPHLTLGYPADPANPDGDKPDHAFYETPFYEVHFNRIAVWTGDFDGPEFLLKDFWDEFDALESVPMDVAMSALNGDETRDAARMAALEHFGVKGMKWGVRKVEGGGEGAHIRVKEKTGRATPSAQTSVAILGTAVIFPPLVPAAFLSKRVRAEVKASRAVNKGAREAKKLGKEEEKFTKHAQQASNFVAIHNGAGPRINREIESINKKYSDVDLTKDTKKRDQYDSEVLKSMQDAYKESANSLTNKSATMHLDVSFHGADRMDVKIEAKKGAPKPMVEHAAGDDDTITFSAKIRRSSTGHIVGFEFGDFNTPVTHSALELTDLGAAFVLEHYGIKGMHWGQRKARTVSTQAHVDSGLLKRKTKLRTTGGESHPAHQDAVEAAVQKQKIKKSGTNSLSTQELRDLANRLQVENQVSILMSSKGKQFVSKELEKEGKAALKVGARKAAPHVVKRAGKGAATVATTAALL